MGLAKRIIPQLLCRGRQLIKGQQYDSWRSVGVVAQAVRIHQARSVDELVLLDIEATRESRGPDLKLVSQLASQCFMPLSVGGGIRSIQDIRDLLNHGADKTVINSASHEVTGFIREASDHFGAQCIVVSVDVKDGKAYIRNGQQSLGVDAVEWAVHMESEGAGEILLNSIDREGTMQGYDLELIESVSRSVNVPVIVSGGCGSYAHMHGALKAGADAVSAGAFFQFTDATPRGAAEYLDKMGEEVRLCA